MLYYIAFWQQNQLCICVLTCYHFLQKIYPQVRKNDISSYLGIFMRYLAAVCIKDKYLGLISKENCTDKKFYFCIYSYAYYRKSPSLLKKYTFFHLGGFFFLWDFIFVRAPFRHHDSDKSQALLGVPECIPVSLQLNVISTKTISYWDSHISRPNSCARAESFALSAVAEIKSPIRPRGSSIFNNSP